MPRAPRVTRNDDKSCACDEPELIQEVRGGSLVVTCQRCGYTAVTTDCPAEWLDETIYTIRVLSADNQLRPLIKFLKSREAMTTPQANAMIEQLGVVFERTGSSREILETARDLARQQIRYRCSPHFPHFIDLQIIVRGSGSSELS